MYPRERSPTVAELTPERLAEIKERDAAKFSPDKVAVTASQADRDRHVLLAEVERLQAQVARVEALADAWAASSMSRRDKWPVPDMVRDLRAALAEPEADR